MVVIRVAGIEDAEVLTELSRRTFHDTFAAQNRPEDMAAYFKQAFVVERIAAEIREPGSVYLVAEQADRLIGFARVAPSLAPACVHGPSPVRLAKLYVAMAALGSGVGAALMRASLDWATQSGHATLWLGVWEHNHRAIRFYRRWGFLPVGTEPFLLGLDQQTDLVMQRLPIESTREIGAANRTSGVTH